MQNNPGYHKFSLLYLDEGEHYIKDFYGSVEFLNKSTLNYENQKARIHFCSRCIIVHSDDPSISICKYYYKNFKEAPQLVENEHLKIKVLRSTEIPAGTVPKPYKQHEKEETLFISTPYSDIAQLYKLIMKLFQLVSLNKNYFAYEQHLDEMFFQNKEFFSNMQFDKTRIKSLSENVLIHKEISIKQILPLVSVDGLLYLTNKRLYFQPLQPIYPKPVLKFQLKSFSTLFKRRYKLMNIGLEFSTSKHKSMYISFNTELERNTVYDLLLKNIPKECESEKAINEFAYIWVSGGMSNFDYLMHLNMYAYRSFSDLSQYPVFPWILTDYTSTKLDLSNPSTFRDLSKPIGALNPQRLSDFKERFKQMIEPKFLYGTHYSTPAYVIGFLVRKYPQYMLKLHSGKFDHPDRLFKSIKKEWQSAYTNPGNLKELIPEFFQEDPSFLTNTLGLDMGVRQNGKRVDNVRLPKWAKSPRDFLQKHREALECDYVSKNLHQWIDLIFGNKQRGKASEDADNLFHPLTYEGSVNIENIENDLERNALEIQIIEFGQTPRQIFNKPHPAKYSQGIPSLLSIPTTEPPVKSQTTTQTGTKLGRSSSSSSDELAHEVKTKLKIEEEEKKIEQVSEVGVSWFKNLSESNINEETLPKLHQKEITSIHVHPEEPNSIITTSKDGFVRVYSRDDSKVKRAFFVSNSGISCSTMLNQTLALGTFDGRISFYNFLTGTVMNTISVHDDTVSGIHFFKSKLLTCSSDNTVRIWNVDEYGTIDESPNIFYDHEDEIIASASNDIDLAATLDAQGNIIVWQVKNESLVNKFNISDGAIDIGRIQFAKSSPEELFVSHNDILSHYETDGSRLEQYEYFEDDIHSFSQDEDSLLIYLGNKSTLVYDWRFVKKINEWRRDRVGTYTCLDSKLKICYVGSEEGDVSIISEKL